MAASKEVARIVQAAGQQGWRVIEKKKGVMMLSPDGVTKVTVHWTPSDKRAVKNTLAAMRQGGFDVPAPLAAA